MRRDGGRAARRETARLLSRLAAEYGECDLLHERVEVTPDERADAADATVSVGGAGAWIRDPDGRVLLVETPDGWAEPARPRRRGEAPVACARRAVREQAGLDATVTGLERVHVRHLADPTGRPPVPQPFVLFRGRAAGEATGRAGWHVRPPAGDLLYERLGDVRRAGSTGRADRPDDR